jgi:leucyl aminopeptidase
MKNDYLNAIIPVQYEKEFKGDTLGFLYFQNDKKEAALTSQSLTEFHDLAKNKIFTGSAKSTYFIRASYIEKTNLLVAGLGSKKIFSPEIARQTGAVIYNKLSSEKVTSFGLDIDDLLKSAPKGQVENFLGALIEGFLLATYTFNKHRTGPKPVEKIASVSLVSKDKKNEAWLNKIAERAMITADCVFVSRNFSNEPSNIGTPEFFAAELQKFSKKFGIKCTVMTEADCKKEKMNLFLSVSAGSDREARVVIMEYTPKTGAKSAKTVSLVGKGVTFDSGGISLKPGMRMEDMKMDMTGAATMVGATLMAARLGAKNKLVTIVAFTENMPNGIATQPGNVITARNGKTVEIINTDAEGRLVLADALDLAQDYKPDVVVNSATLTGACSIALGKLASALFSNDEKLTRQIFAVTDKTEEKLWELPVWDEYIDDMKAASSAADFANVANDSNGGTIRGAVFLKQFIREGQKWAHIDLANRAYDQGYLPYNPKKGACGVYVRTFAEFVMGY